MPRPAALLRSLVPPARSRRWAATIACVGMVVLFPLSVLASFGVAVGASRDVWGVHFSSGSVSIFHEHNPAAPVVASRPIEPFFQIERNFDISLWFGVKREVWAAVTLGPAATSTPTPMTTWTTYYAPLWLPLALAAVGTLLSWRSFARERAAQRGVVCECGYSLKELPVGSACPECGRRSTIAAAAGAP